MSDELAAAKAEAARVRAQMKSAHHQLLKALAPIISSVKATYPSHPLYLKGQFVCRQCLCIAILDGDLQSHSPQCPVPAIIRALNWLKPTEELEADAFTRQWVLRNIRADETRRFERIRANIHTLTESKKKARKRRQ
jgi:hypothetical protein